MPAPHRVAVIGLTGKGDYSHGLDVVWKELQNVQVVAVADPDEQGRAKAAERLRAPKAYADYREMLEKERPAIVSIAVRWVDAHRDMVLACAEYGSNMLLEKPMARTLKEADEMVAACEAHHVKVAVAHQARHSLRIRHAHDLLKAGKLGRILEFRGRGKEDHRGGGEDLMVLGTHIMDLMRLLGGNPGWCMARVLEKGEPVTKRQVREGAEGIGPLAGDEVHAMYGMASPTTGYFSSQKSKDGAGARWGLHVFAEKGIMTIGGPGMPGSASVYYTEDPSWMPGTGKSPWIEITSAGPGRPEPMKDLHPQGPANVLMAQDLIRAIETDTQPAGSIYDGRAALEMILAVYESHRQAGPVKLPLKNREHPLTLL